MGQVLIRFDPHVFMARFGISEEDEKLLMRNVYRTLEWAMLDRGSLSEEEACARMCARIPERLHDTVQKLVSMWDRPILPVEGMSQLAGALAARGYHLFLLSNASVRQHEYWPRIPGSEYFEDTLISADVHLVKPQPEIYLEAYRKFRILPEESLFIDDVPLNIEGAYYTGMDGCVFHDDIPELKAELCRKGIQIS